MGNALMDNRFEGIFLGAGTATVDPNKIDPRTIAILAISFDGDDTNATGITCNEITAAAQAGIRLLDDNPADPFMPMVTANNNSITGNTAGIDNQTPVAVNAQQNWPPAT